MQYLKAKVLFWSCLVCILSFPDFTLSKHTCTVIVLSYAQPWIFFWLQNHFSSSYFVSFLHCTHCVTPENIHISTIRGILSKTPCPLETPFKCHTFLYFFGHAPLDCPTVCQVNMFANCWSHIHTGQLVSPSTHL